MSAKKLAEHFSELEDPRCSGKVEHLLIDILVIAVCAVIAGAESWVDMALYGQNKADWLSTFLRLPNGIPAHDTFRRVFMLIDPEDFESRFTAWTQAFAVSVDREVVAIDGKTVRGSFDRSRDQGPLHIVSAWASERGLVLGQRQVGDKSNEITAVPELLDTLDLKGSIVTLDAMGCQKAIVCHPRTGRRLSRHAQGQSGQDLCRGARSLPGNLFCTWRIQPAGLRPVR
jgi:predicted transposase YbfD/YdcC